MTEHDEQEYRTNSAVGITHNGQHRPRHQRPIFLTRSHPRTHITAHTHALSWNVQHGLPISSSPVSCITQITISHPPVNPPGACNRVTMPPQRAVFWVVASNTLLRGTISAVKICSPRALLNIVVARSQVTPTACSTSARRTSMDFLDSASLGWSCEAASGDM